MNLQNVLNRLNFFVNKYTGAWYTIPELEDLLDSGQLALYSDYKKIYATSQLVKDALSPFRTKYDFTPSDTISGYIVVPSNSNYLDLLAIQISYQISNRIFYWPVSMVNEDEIADRLNSQIDPVTVTSPIGEQTAPRYFRLYPLSGYTGTVTYFRRPVKPVFSYTTISGRVIVYDPVNSVQLEWRDSEIGELLIKSIKLIAPNLSDAELWEVGQMQSQLNFQGVNRL